MKKIFFIAFSIISISASAQLMTLGFVKNSMSYNRTAFENELFKKHFFKTANAVEAPTNAMLTGACAYSNEQKTSDGEIKVLSLITEKQKITEITFINGPKNDWSKNFTEVYNQMVSFFNNQTAFKTKKFDPNKETEVTKFSKDNSYYYVYKLKDNMVIVVSNQKLEDTYFK